MYHSFRLPFGAAVLFLTSCLTAAAQPAKSPATRLPVPDEAAIEKAEALVKEVYQADFARKKPADLVELARKLLKAADETPDNPAARFVLYREARDLAARGGDVGLALEAAAALGQAFKLDPGELTAATLEAADRGRAAPSRVVADAATEAADAALDADDYALADRLLKLAGVAASRANSAALLGGVATRVKVLDATRKAYAALEPDRKALAANPNDPAANARVGRFFCFVKGDWDAGLPHLAKGDDEKLKAAAELDLAGPVSATEQAALADRWFGLSAGLAAPERAEVRGRALQWYRQALPDLTGLPKARVEQREAEIVKSQPKSARDRGVWVVIFRSADPAIWNTNTNRGPDQFAVALNKVPADIKYLKLTEKRKKQSVIIEMARDRLGKQSEQNGYGWNGTNESRWNGRHLGVYDLALDSTPRGTICLQAAAPGYRGWGFGHRSLQDDTQGYSWDGQPVEKTVFEVAVKAGTLAPGEARRLLRKGRRVSVWASPIPPGRYSVSYAGDVKATTVLEKDGTFTRVKDGKTYSGAVEFRAGTLVLRSEEFVEVWTASGQAIGVEHWWPAATYPKGKPQSTGKAARVKD